MRNLKKEIFKRILGYGVPIAIIIYIAIPQGISHKGSDENDRKNFIIGTAQTLFSFTSLYVFDNKKLPKNQDELLNYAKKIKFSPITAIFFDEDNRSYKYFKRLIKLIKVYDLPDINTVKTFKTVKEDANIAYYFSKKGNNVTVAFYIIDSEGKFLVDTKNNLFSYIEEFEITK